VSKAGKHAIVTGGSSGIGSAIVERLEEAGTKVAILDLNKPGAGSGAAFFECDVTDEPTVIAAVAEAAAHLGGLDRAFLNAGVGASGALVDLSGEEWDRVHAVDLRGVFLTLREAAKVMLAAGGRGSMVVTASVCGFLTDRRMSHYNSAKAGAISLAKVAAAELGCSGIRVNVVAPGVTETPMSAVTDTMLVGYRDAVTHRTPLGAFGDPRHVADAAVTLSDLEWVTGQVLAADGGLSLFSPIDLEDFLPEAAGTAKWLAGSGVGDA
jgi:NAD(P)-dependent dehydrogenase (short-subunit alcohol dehydrogenase family)